jgi:hypothetical protein
MKDEDIRKYAKDFAESYQESLEAELIGPYKSRIAELEEQVGKARDKGAKSMLHYITDHWTISKMITDEALFAYWKQDKKDPK